MLNRYNNRTFQNMNENQDYKIFSSPHIHFQDTVVPFWGLSIINSDCWFTQQILAVPPTPWSWPGQFTLTERRFYCPSTGPSIVTLLIGSIDGHLDNQPTHKTLTITELYAVSSQSKNGNENIHSMWRNNWFFMR